MALTQAAGPSIRAADSPDGDEPPMLRSDAQSSRIFAFDSKLRVDLRPTTSVIARMTEERVPDAETARLIEELLTRVGMIMEDASVIALVRDAVEGGLDQRIEQLERSAASIHLLVGAAKALFGG